MENIALQLDNVVKTFRIAKPASIFNKIKMRNDSKQFKSLTVLDGISFTVQKGEALGIIGSNGSGKTTLLRIIARIYKPNQGSVKINGRLSPLLQIGTGFQNELNAKENIIMNGLLLGVSKSYIEGKVPEIIQFAELEKFSHLKLKHYSTGMRARLGFATAMQIDPDILLVDELLSVGDKDFSKKSYEYFLSLKKQKKTILYATHSLQNLSEFCDRVLFLEKGRIAAIGNPDEVVKKYLEARPS